MGNLSITRKYSVGHGEKNEEVLICVEWNGGSLKKKSLSLTTKGVKRDMPVVRPGVIHVSIILVIRLLYRKKHSMQNAQPMR